MRQLRLSLVRVVDEPLEGLPFFLSTAQDSGRYLLITSEKFKTLDESHTGQ